MSNISNLISEKAEYVANLSNITVLNSLLNYINADKSPISCNNCLFPTNKNEFKDLLKRYIKHKITLHRLKRYYYSDSPKVQDNTVYRCTSYTELVRTDATCVNLRQQLTTIWPCQDCINKYNPTSRIKK